MKLTLTLSLLLAPILANAQGYRYQVFTSPAQQFSYGAQAFVAQPVYRGSQQVYQQYAPVVNQTYQWANGARTVYGVGNNLIRYGTPPVIMITPPGGYNYVVPGAQFRGHH